MNKFTPGPWVLGSWTIHDEDREAQKRREPYWTLVLGEDYLAQGPYGRKALDIDAVVMGTGYECDGLYFKNKADANLITAAPEIYEALKKIINNYGADKRTMGDLIDTARTALAKAEGKI